jgi:hypothetical protein
MCARIGLISRHHPFEIDGHWVSDAKVNCVE